MLLAHSLLDGAFVSCYSKHKEKMEFHVIELPKLPKELRAGSGGVELWGRFISSEREEEVSMLAEKDPYIESAYERLRAISQD